MKLRMAFVTAAAAVLLSGARADRVEAGWFGLGGSGKSTEASKAPTTHVYNPNNIASGPARTSANSKKSASSGLAGLFGLGKPSSNTPPPRKPASSAAKSKKDDTSWWSSWFKPKEPPPPKNTNEWMKLKPVRW